MDICLPRSISLSTNHFQEIGWTRPGGNDMPSNFTTSAANTLWRQPPAAPSRPRSQT